MSVREESRFRYPASVHAFPSLASSLIIWLYRIGDCRGKGAENRQTNQPRMAAPSQRLFRESGRDRRFPVLFDVFRECTRHGFRGVVGKESISRLYQRGPLLDGFVLLYSLPFSIFGRVARVV